MLRSPGERGERGLVILPENLKLPATVGINVETFQSLKGGTINQLAFLSSKKKKKKTKKKQGLS